MMTLRTKPTEAWRSRLAIAAVGLGMVWPAVAPAQLRIVTSLPTYASIAEELVGEFGTVAAIARGDEDPHFVNPRPSFAAMLQRADVFVTTGLDLELWVPALLDRANNPKVVEGAPGHVVAYAGVTLLDVPENVSRAGGDIHVFGNPHIHTDPINGIVIARNIAEALVTADPPNAALYRANLAAFEAKVVERTFGPRLVELLGAETLIDLSRTYRFWDFVSAREYDGKPLADYVGGWLADGAAFRDRDIVCYHKNWAYFSARFRVRCAMFVEPKPGIPPAPGHVRDVIDFIREEKIPVILAANYFSRSQVERVASRTGAQALIVAEHVGGTEAATDYVTLLDTWVQSLRGAFTASK